MKRRFIILGATVLLIFAAFLFATYSLPTPVPPPTEAPQPQMTPQECMRLCILRTAATADLDATCPACADADQTMASYQACFRQSGCYAALLSFCALECEAPDA